MMRQHMCTVGTDGQPSQSPDNGPPPTVRTQSRPCLYQHIILSNMVSLSLMISMCGECACPVVKADVHFPHPPEAGQGLACDSQKSFSGGGGKPGAPPPPSSKSDALL